MNLPSFRIRRQYSAWLWFAIAIGGCSVVLALLLPSINRVKAHYLNQQLQQARAAQTRGDNAAAIATLQRANWVRFGDPRPLLQLGEEYESLGQYHNALAAYQQLSFNQGYIKAGAVALKSQEYHTAQTIYQRAADKKRGADNFAALALADFNLSQTTAGCTAAKRASEANLGSDLARQASVVCLLIQKQVGEAKSQYADITGGLVDSPRSVAYTLINFGAVKAGENQLNQVATKTPTDWLLLARIAAARGDLTLAISRAKNGLKLDATNVELNRALLSYYRLSGQAGDEKAVVEHLHDLGIN